MTAITSRSQIMQNLAQGLGVWGIQTSQTGTSLTGAAAASGFLTSQLRFNNIGTTLPSTLQGFPLPPSPPNDLPGIFSGFGGSGAVTRAVYLANVYKIGTLDLGPPHERWTPS